MKNEKMYCIYLLSIMLVFHGLCFADEDKTDSFPLAPLLMETTYKIQCEKIIGTAFILGHTVKDSGRAIHYVLITAKHVLEDFTKQKAILHMRKKNDDHYERLLHEFPIRNNGKPLWVSHPSEDVAVLKIAIPKESNTASVGVVSTSLLASDEMLKKYAIQSGDELMVLGFPFGAESNNSGFPVLRSGRIASYPLTPTSQYKTFLLDFEVFRGNSGGPVFIYDRNRFFDNKLHLGRVRFIMGLVSKEKNVTEEIQTIEELRVKNYRLSLAEIVEASLIREVIETLFPGNPIPAFSIDDITPQKKSKNENN